MAWDFASEIHALTGFDADGSGNTSTEDTYRTHTAQWLKDSAKEVINQLPNHLLPLCSAEQSFTSGTPNVLNTGKIINVFRSDGDIKQPCRQLDVSYKERALDDDDMEYATVTDPVYFIENNTIDVLPKSGSVTYSEVQFPSISFDDTAIATFPDEAERVVVLGAAIKAAEYMLANEEDIELLNPILSQLKDDYKQGIESIK